MIKPDLSFSPEEYRARIDAAKQRLEPLGVDVLLLNSCPSICYLSGYQSWNTADYYALVLPARGEPSLVMWESELSNAKLTSCVADVRTYPTRGDPVATTIGIISDMQGHASRIGLETGSRYLSARTYERIVNSFPGASFVDCSDLVPSLQTIKSPSEVRYLRKAASITDRGMSAAVEGAAIGATDQDVAASAYHALVSGGSEYMCIPPVVCVGYQAGIPHSTHRGIPIHAGDTILLEMGACVDRYTAPMMRTVVIGEPSDRIRRVADAILATLNDVIAAMVPGRAFHDVAVIGEAAIARAGAHLIFHHTYAYSVGLGYPPTWADCSVTIVLGDPTVLRPGMVFHLPISLRDEGRFGIAMSETVLITDTGNEVLTHMERTLYQR
jgi:Xaa-Pro dipeptidase